MWYHIRAYEPSIKMTIQFWLYAKSREELDKILKEKVLDKTTENDYLIKHSIPIKYSFTNPNLGRFIILYPF